MVITLICKHTSKNVLTLREHIKLLLDCKELSDNEILEILSSSWSSSKLEISTMMNEIENRRKL